MRPAESGWYTEDVRNPKTVAPSHTRSLACEQSGNGRQVNVKDTYPQESIHFNFTNTLLYFDHIGVLAPS